VLVDGWENARWGKNCKIIKCQEAKGVRFCYECDVYPDCKRFRSIADHSLKRGEDLVANLAKIKAGKVEEWLEEEDKKWRCPKCGNPFLYTSMSATGAVQTLEKLRAVRACGYGFCWDRFCIWSKGGLL
jgi:ssDNA-binding Zn-finger/Zn-ribbon topoisomerase 1